MKNPDIVFVTTMEEQAENVFTAIEDALKDNAAIQDHLDKEKND